MTARISSDLAVPESEARFRNMADNAPVMMWVTEPDGNCSYLNARWYEFTGQTVAESLGLGWTRATHPDDQARVASAFHAANAACAPLRLEYRLRTVAGDYRWVLDAASPRLSPAGTFLGYVGSVIDIDERREAEHRLQVSEGRFRAAVGAVAGIVWTNDSVGKMVGEQPGWAGLTGQSIIEYGGYGWAAAVHPEDAAPTIAAWKEAVANRHAFVFEHRVRRSDGVWRRYAVRAVPTFDSAGNIAEWVGIHTDISDQRAAEAALRELNEQLESRVEAAVAERISAEQALRHSQKMDAIGQLTGGIAHDFNNMLTIIISAVSLLERRVDADPQSRKLVEAALDGARRAAALIARLLAFARQQPLEPREVDIDALVTGLAPLLRHSLGGRVRLDLQLAASPCLTVVDPDQLENALVNLAVNARDAIAVTGVVTVTTGIVAGLSPLLVEHGLAPAAHVRICVTDDGAGISAEVRDKIFEPFFTTKAEGKGTGLGLSQVYGFVKQSGGAIDIASQPGNGTRVAVYLRIAEPA